MIKQTLIFAEGSEKDIDLLLEYAQKLGINLSRKDKSYTVEEKQKLNKNAYQPWTNEDDEKLEILYYAGKRVAELVNVFGRNEGAITSRIKKLELFEKYGK